MSAKAKINAVNQDILTRLSLYARQDRLAHAYLFLGTPYLGKVETAMAAAKMMNCENPPEEETHFFCDKCPSCLKINSSNHPDVVVIRAGEGGKIIIEQVRAVIAQAKLRPFSAEKKVFIIKNIESLTPEGANSFLKTLEEPSANCLIFLTATSLENVLDTIVSRCHVLRFHSMSVGELKEILMTSEGLDDVRAHFLAYFSQGCLGKAKSLMKSKIFEKRTEIIDEFILAHNADAYIKKIAADKTKTAALLDVLLSWMRDALFIKSGIQQGKLIHCDCYHEIDQFQKKYSFDELLDVMDEVVKTYRMLVNNLNIKLPLTLIKTALA